MGNTMLPILGLGLASSLYYFFPINQGQQRNSFVFNTWLQMLVVGGLFIIAFLFVGENLLHVLGMDVLGESGNILSIYIMFLLSGTLIDFLLILEQRIHLSMTFNPIDKLFRLFLVVGVAFWYNSVTWCMVALMVYAALRFGFITYHVVTRYYSGSNWNMVIPNMKTQLVYSLPFAAGIIFTTISQRIDKLVVNRYVEPEDFAMYSLAFFSIPLVDQAFSSINNVVTPQISSYLKEGKVNETLKLYRQVVGKTSSIAFPAIVYFTLMAPELITLLFTVEYSAAVPYYRVYLVMFVFTMTSYGIVLRGAGKTKWIMFSNLIGALVTVLVGLVIIPTHGLWGAIVTAICGIAVPVVFQLYFEKNVLHTDFRDHLPWGEIFLGLSCSLVCVIPIYFLRQIPLNDFFVLAITSAIYFPLVAIAEWKLGIFAFEKQVRHLLNS
jgi:O-antigen/teichoic acid export membrane protein